MRCDFSLETMDLSREWINTTKAPKKLNKEKFQCIILHPVKKKSFTKEDEVKIYPYNESEENLSLAELNCKYYFFRLKGNQKKLGLLLFGLLAKSK